MVTVWSKLKMLIVVKNLEYTFPIIKHSVYVSRAREAGRGGGKIDGAKIFFFFFSLTTTKNLCTFR